MAWINPTGALWAARASTVALAVAVAYALDGSSGFAAAWWVVVAGLLVALAVPAPIGLTVVRMVVPITVPVTAALVVADTSDPTAVTALALSAVSTAIVLTGELGEAFVQAAAYGHERRFPLRVPAAVAPVLVGAWAVWAAAVVGAVVAVDSERWWLAVGLGVPALAVTWPLFARCHQLSRRWLVLVPAGVVVHDPVLLGETLLVMRPNVAGVRLAPADTEAADLTGPTSGYAIEVSVREMVLVHFAGTRREPKGRAIHAAAFLVAPTRPGKALRHLQP